MSNLKIIFTNSSSLKPVLFVNNRQVILKKETGKLVGKIECDSIAHVQIFNYHPLNDPFGILVGYFFFLISILGIFDKRYKSKARRVLFEADVEVSCSTELTIHYEPFHIDKDYVSYSCSDNIMIIDNKCFIDQGLQKKIRILFFLKLITWIGLILSIIIIVFKKFF